MSNDRDLLRELLNSAESPEDLEAVAALIAEHEAKPKPDRWTVSTLAEVAEFLGLNVQTVKQFRQESPPMPGDPGAWPLPAIVKWRHAKLSQSDLKTEKQQLDIDMGKVALETRRLELDRDKGLLVEIAEVERWAATAIAGRRENTSLIAWGRSRSAPSSSSR